MELEATAFMKYVSVIHQYHTFTFLLLTDIVQMKRSVEMKGLQRWLATTIYPGDGLHYADVGL